MEVFVIQTVYEYVNYIEDLKNDLSILGFESGTVYVDYFVRNGFSKNRFLKIPFESEQFKFNSGELLTDEKFTIQKIFDEYIDENQYLIDRSLLPQSAKDNLKKKR